MPDRGRTNLSSLENLTLDNPTKFVIFGTQRTGTTLVRTSLSSHPEILCCGEVFNLGKRPYSHADGFWAYSRSSLNHRIQTLFKPESLTESYLKQLYSNSNVSAVGFKLMLNHCTARPYIWHLLSEQKIRGLLIWRENALKTLVSRRIAAKSGVYHVSSSLKAKSAVKEWAGSTVTIDTHSLLRELEDITLEPDAWRKLLRQEIEYIDVVYEEYVENMRLGNDRILDFLSIDQRPLTSDLKKVNQDSLCNLISNYDEVYDLLKGSEYSRFLD